MITDSHQLNSLFNYTNSLFQKFLQLEEISFKELCTKKDATAIAIDNISAKWDKVHLQLYTNIDLRRVQQWERLRALVVLAPFIFLKCKA